MSLGFRNCKYTPCGKRFEKLRPLQYVCSPQCATAYTREKEKAKRDTAWRKEKKVRKDALKSRSDWMKELQIIVNFIARQIDVGLSCLCDNCSGSGDMHGAHFYSVGSDPTLRFNLHNIHRNCISCNTHKGGNVLNYREGIRIEYGQEYLDKCEGMKSKYLISKWSIEQIQEAIVVARQIKKELAAIDQVKYPVKARIRLRDKINKRLNLYPC